jgi:hypothetical protein
MLDDAISYEARSFQAEFLKRLHRVGGYRHDPQIPALLVKLQNTESTILEFALGDYGKVLSGFCETLDLEHPDIASFFDGFFCDGNLFAQRCMELIELAKIAKDANFKTIFPLIGKMLLEESIEKNILKRLDVTNQYKFHVRLIKDRVRREEIRCTKKIQAIDLQALQKKGEEIWNSQPSDFKKFLRFDAAYTAELRQAERKMRRYEELGCSSLATEIKKSIDSFRDNMDQSYYGFNRITMTNISIILAKSLGFHYNPKHFDSVSYMTHFEPMISVPKSFFNDYNFDPITTPEYIPVSTSTIYVQSRSDSYAYEPRVYPLHELQSVMPKSASEIIDTLENFPDAEGRPIFDHFGIIVPGISYSFHHFVNTEGCLESYNSSEECCRAMDRLFIKNKFFYPVIVGEKDGKCFFVSYWM